jgi:hypothetical protein
VPTDNHLAIDLNNDGARWVLTGFDDWAEVHQFLADEDKHPKHPAQLIPRKALLVVRAYKLRVFHPPWAATGREKKGALARGAKPPPCPVGIPRSGCPIPG